MDVPPPPSFGLSTMQVCDCCRRRKLRCDRQFPCGACKNSLLHCSYNHVLQRKGPKPDKRFSCPTTRRNEADNHGSPNSATSSRFQSPRSEGNSGCSWPSTTESSPSPSSEELPQRPASTAKIATSLPQTQPQRLSPWVVLAHVSVYLKYLFPIMPVFDPDAVIRDSTEVECLPSERYAFLAALCAITHIQLKLDGPGLNEEATSISGDALLSEAVRARNEFDSTENVSLDSLLTAFYLFASYGNLEKHCQASFYLCQAVCMVHTLGLNRESEYIKMDPGTADTCRRIFWLLFVSERAYALQRSRPVMSRNSIQKPDIFETEDPSVACGFLNLIAIYEKLPVELYDLMSSGYDNESSGFALASYIYGSLNFPLSLEGVSETQQVDIIATQQWLQTVMWKLGPGRSPHKLLDSTGWIPFDTPLSAAYSILDVFSSVSQASIDAHGISMEQKLFDVGTCVADVARFTRSSWFASTDFPPMRPVGLLWGILNSLSNIRGSQSHLFPALLGLSGDVLDLESPPIFSTSLTSPENFPTSMDCWSAAVEDEEGQSEPEAQRAALENFVSQLESSLTTSTRRKV